MQLALYGSLKHTEGSCIYFQMILEQEKRTDDDIDHKDIFPLIFLLQFPKL